MRTYSFFLLAFAALALVGCDSLNSLGSPSGAGHNESAPVADLAIALLWDPTITAAENRAAADQMLQRVLRSQSIPKGTHIAIIRIDADPQILFDGVKGNPEKLMDAWAEASTSKLTGTDQVRAFQEALNWFNAPEQASAKQKMLVAWTDLVPDPWKSGTRLNRKATDPRAFDWGNARALNLRVVIAGVPYGLQNQLRKLWEPRFVIQPRLYGPRHDLQLSDLGLEANDSIF